MPKKVYWCDVFINGSMVQGNIHIGTSGWSYGEWKGGFYPEKMKSTDWLTEYAKTFDCTGINSSFYHMPRQKTVEGWVAKVPDGFKFCPKVSRYLTHIKRLNEPEEPLTRFFDVFDLIKEHSYAEAVTSHIVYVRFHRPGSLYSSPYSDEMMRDYAEKFKQWSKNGN